MKKTFNKLVRDKMPEIIAGNGHIAHTRILDEAEYSQALRTKLGEEVQEYLNDQNIEELADIMELLYALTALHDSTPAELESVRAKKEAKRGGFAKRVFLESTEE